MFEVCLCYYIKFVVEYDLDPYTEIISTPRREDHPPSAAPILIMIHEALLANWKNYP